jgi:hypothetical protein
MFIDIGNFDINIIKSKENICIYVSISCSFKIKESLNTIQWRYSESFFNLSCDKIHSITLRGGSLVEKNVKRVETSAGNIIRSRCVATGCLRSV